jgi:hypothetical protein
MDTETASQAPARHGRRFEKGNTAGVATRFRPGNTAALTTGAYSALTRARDRQREAALAKAGILVSLQESCDAMESEITVRQGFRCTIAQQGMVRRYCELDGMIATIFDRLMESGGPITAAGRTKHALERYDRLTNTQAKIANLLGLPKAARTALPDLPAVGRDQYARED